MDKILLRYVLTNYTILYFKMNKRKLKILGIGIAILFFISYSQYKELKNYDLFLAEEFYNKHKNEIEKLKLVQDKTLRDIENRDKFYDFLYTNKKNSIEGRYQSGLISTEQMADELNELDDEFTERSLRDIEMLSSIKIPEYKTPKKTERIMTLWVFGMFVSVLYGIVVIVGIKFDK